MPSPSVELGLTRKASAVTLNGRVWKRPATHCFEISVELYSGKRDTSYS
jgi:hypothetical protein